MSPHAMTAPLSPEMDDLVERTRGVQPLRRLFHAFNGIVVAVALTWIDLPRWTLLAILAAIPAGLLLLDLVRLRVPRANRVFFRAFRHLASPREAEGVASSTWYALGLLVTVAVFPLEAAVSGVLVLAVCDPAASLLGQRFGRRPFLGGSVEGSATFLITALVILAARHSPGIAAGAALAAMLVERLSWPLDDNFTLPPATAAAVMLLERAM